MDLIEFISDDSALLEKRFNDNQEKLAQELFEQVFDGTIEIYGCKTYFDKLKTYHIQKYKKVNLMMDELEPPSIEQKHEKMFYLAENSKLINNEYYITIFLGGRIPFELKLFDYVPWTKEDEYFVIFKEEFNKRGI